MSDRQPTTSVLALGQTGYRFEAQGTVLFIDPYLSDSVRRREGEHLERLLPIPIAPADINDADFVLVTHEHLDHCDPETLLPMARSSPGCVFVGPPLAVAAMREFGIPDDRLREAVMGPAQALGSFTVTTVPSAHPDLEVDANDNYLRVGFVIDTGCQRVYHAGDTAVHETVIAALRAAGPVDVGMIPVNEQNYYRAREGIIGNMSVREAFQFAEDIGVRILVPTHWNMFAANQVFREEIELLYKLLQPPFELRFELDAV